MNKEEIKEYLKRVDELEAKLTEEDKETYNWLIYGYNQCAKLLNETEQENKQLKDNWNELKKWVIEQEQKEVKVKETKIKILEAEIEQLYEFIAKIQHLGEIEQQRLVNLESKGEE